MTPMCSQDQKPLLWTRVKLILPMLSRHFPSPSFSEDPELFSWCQRLGGCVILGIQTVGHQMTVCVYIHACVYLDIQMCVHLAFGIENITLNLTSESFYWLSDAVTHMYLFTWYLLNTCCVPESMPVYYSTSYLWLMGKAVMEQP